MKILTMSFKFISSDGMMNVGIVISELAISIIRARVFKSLRVHVYFFMIL